MQRARSRRKKSSQAHWEYLGVSGSILLHSVNIITTRVKLKGKFKQILRRSQYGKGFNGEMEMEISGHPVPRREVKLLGQSYCCADRCVAALLFCHGGCIEVASRCVATAESE